MILELTGNETQQDFTDDLRERLLVDEPYYHIMAQKLSPLEAIIKTDMIIEPYTNHRVMEVNGDFYIPIATYTDGCRVDSVNAYTAFDEVKEWAEAYGIDNVFVGILSDYAPSEDLIDKN